MKTLVKFMLFCFLLVIELPSFAQADIGMATSLYTRAYTNPASIARINYMYFFTSTRQQWVGLEGAPKVYFLQASDYIHNLRSAFGVSVMSDQIGNSNVLNPLLSYAFRLQGHRDHVLRFGISAGIFKRTINGNGYIADANIDPAIDYSVEKVVKPDANVGLEFLSEYFILGLSSTHLFSIAKSDDAYLNSNYRYGYLIFKKNSKLFYYRIGVQAKNRNNITTFEGNALFSLKHGTGLMSGPIEIFDFGIAINSSRKMAFLIGVLATPNLRICYAYDQNFIHEYYQYTTHELMLQYKIYHKAASTRGCGRK